MTYGWRAMGCAGLGGLAAAEACLNKANYITIHKSMFGWRAIEIWWNQDLGGFWEPWQTGLGTYATKEEAAEEGRAWAEAEGLEFHEPQ